MKLRPELLPPELDPQRVEHLTALVSSIDGGDRHEVAPLLDEFNRLASTSFEFHQLQGILGSQDHDTWVRVVLASPAVQLLPDITEPELVELARRVMDAEGSEHAIQFWLELLERNLPGCKISDLIFWPDAYCSGGYASDDLTPEQIICLALDDSDRRLVGR